MKSKEEKVYLVGECGPEHNILRSIHKTHKGAFKAWNKLRKDLLENAKSHLKKFDEDTNDMYETMVKNLSCEDPKLIDNFPHDTPYLREDKIEK